MRTFYACLATGSLAFLLGNFTGGWEWKQVAEYRAQSIAGWRSAYDTLESVIDAQKGTIETQGRTFGIQQRTIDLLDHALADRIPAWTTLRPERPKGSVHCTVILAEDSH